jgi:hypothetical protein
MNSTLCCFGAFLSFFRWAFIIIWNYEIVFFLLFLSLCSFGLPFGSLLAFCGSSIIIQIRLNKVKFINGLFLISLLHLFELLFGLPFLSHLIFVKHGVILFRAHCCILLEFTFRKCSFLSFDAMSGVFVCFVVFSSECWFLSGWKCVELLSDLLIHT